MTFTIKRPCRSPGCSALVEAGSGAYCPPHTRAVHQVARVRDRFRGTAHERGYTSEWSTESKGFLAQFPLCPGVLIPDRTLWTPRLAERFHEIRLAAQLQGSLLGLADPDSPQRKFLELYPIYRVQPWDVAQPATVVDHIIPHRGDQELFWAVYNWQPVTKRAHDKKTAREDRGPALGSQPSALS